MAMVRRLLVLLATVTMFVAGMALAPSALAVPPSFVYPQPTFGDRKVDLTFSAPFSEDFSQQLVNATYQRSLDGGATWQTLNSTTDGAGQVTATITGLQNGTQYSIQVRAIDDGDVGPASDPVTGTPGIPTAPSLGEPTPGDRSAEVPITTPAQGGGFPITSYELSRATSSGVRNWQPAALSADGSTIALTGLTNGTRYYIAVRARNQNGYGAESAEVSVVPGRPTAPQNLSAAPGDQSANVTFSAPVSTGGFDITGYEISATVDDTRDWQPADVTDDGAGNYSAVVTPLLNGSPYNIAVRALNPGEGVEAVTQVVPDAAPGAPTDVLATTTPSNAPSVLGTATATVAFNPPPGGGGTNPSDSTSFTATASPGGAQGSCFDASCRSIDVSGLTNGTAYTFSVVATNASNLSSEPGVSNTVVPSGAPYPPRTLLRAGAGPNSATVSFLSPYFSGRGVTSYQVSSDNGKTWRGASVRASGARRLVTATGLRPGIRYTIRVRAVNALGTGASSSGVVSLTGPSIVSGRPTARAGTSAALIRWTASRERDVFGYYVVSSRGARCYTYTRTETSCVIGNTAGVNTSYRVYARSASGSSYASAASNVVRASAPPVPSQVPGVPAGFAYRSSKVTSGKTATLTARGFLPSSSVVLVGYGAKRHIVKRFVTTATGSFVAKFPMPKDTASTLTFVAFGSTPYGSSKAIGTTIRRR